MPLQKHRVISKNDMEIYSVERDVDPLRASQDPIFMFHVSVSKPSSKSQASL